MSEDKVEFWEKYEPTGDGRQRVSLSTDKGATWRFLKFVDLPPFGTDIASITHKQWKPIGFKEIIE